MPSAIFKGISYEGIYCQKGHFTAYLNSVSGNRSLFHRSVAISKKGQLLQTTLMAIIFYPIKIAICYIFWYKVCCKKKTSESKSLKILYFLTDFNILCAILKIRFWEFQNGKMSKNSSKIDQDTAKTIKRKILKNFLSYFCPFYHFGILKFLSLKWHTVYQNRSKNKVSIAI